MKSEISVNPNNKNKRIIRQEKTKIHRKHGYKSPEKNVSISNPVIRKGQYIIIYLYFSQESKASLTFKNQFISFTTLTE